MMSAATEESTQVGANTWSLYNSDGERFVSAYSLEQMMQKVLKGISLDLLSQQGYFMQNDNVCSRYFFTTREVTINSTDPPLTTYEPAGADEEMIGNEYGQE